MVMDAYNFSYLGGRDWGEHGPRLALDKNARPHLKNNSSKKSGSIVA
jgi:hypothetical protein